MTINVMDEYIKIVKEQIYEYIKLVFANKYKKNYCDYYLEKYINTRYYNFDKNDTGRKIREKIIDKIKEVQEDLTIQNIADRELLEQISVFFYYVLYFDKVIIYENIESKIERISKLRSRVLKIDTQDFKKELYKQTQHYEKEKEELLQSFSSEEFFLKLKSYPDNSNVYRIKLKHKIDFPPQYSAFAIEKAFNMGLTNEDKLTIEYYLITARIINDIINKNFKNHYVLEFSHTLLQKPKKIKTILNVLDNEGIKEKISIKLKYEHFLENKEKVYELIRDGFHITVILDNSFEANIKNVQSLEMFKYVIINKNLKNIKEIKENIKEVKNGYIHKIFI